ncbi:hypothetical protein ACOMHN_003066 [Nucella lapillus]
MDKGVVMEGRMVVEEDEEVYITNIKRAIVSQLQLPISNWKEYQQPITLHDQFGECPTQVSLHGPSRSLWTQRDVSQCSLPQVFGRHRSVLSMAKQFQLHVLHRPISEIVYPFESKVDCRYKIKNSKIEASTCRHGQTFKPITFDGELTAATAVNVTGRGKGGGAGERGRGGGKGEGRGKGGGAGERGRGGGRGEGRGKGGGAGEGGRGGGGGKGRGRGEGAGEGRGKGGGAGERGRGGGRGKGRGGAGERGRGGGRGEGRGKGEGGRGGGGGKGRGKGEGRGKGGGAGEGGRGGGGAGEGGRSGGGAGERGKGEGRGKGGGAGERGKGGGGGRGEGRWKGGGTGEGRGKGGRGEGGEGGRGGGRGEGRGRGGGKGGGAGEGGRGGGRGEGRGEGAGEGAGEGGKGGGAGEGTLILEVSRKLSGKKPHVNRNLKGRKIVRLMMDLEVASPQKVDSSRLLTTLDHIILDVSESQSSEKNEAPETFRTFVDLARDAGSEVLEEVLMKVAACREPERCALSDFPAEMEAAALQKQREWFFADGMLSCGTEACVATYLKGVQQGLVYSAYAQLSLMNMALFYHPAPAVLTNMLALCQTPQYISSSHCWLTLGTLTGRMALALGSADPPLSEDAVQEGQEAIRQVLQHLHAMMGDSCNADGPSAPSGPNPQQQQKMASLLLILKSLANAGEALRMKKGPEGLKKSVLQCMDNPHLPDSVSSAAVMVVSKMELDSRVHSALTALLEDPARPVALRAMAFDRLIGHDNVTTVRHLADVIRGEKLSSLQTYMVTRVGHLEESNDPEGYSLRTLWRSVLETKPLPVLEEIKGRGSQYGEFSRYVELPLAKHQLGGKLGVRVVFEPSSLVPSQLRVSVSFLLFNHSVDLLDIGVDMQGFENVARELLGRGLNSKDDIGAVIARVIEAILPKNGEAPDMFFHDWRVVKGLKQLFTKINMPTADSVQAQVHVKMFGSEVGYVDLQDIIRMVRGQNPMGGGPSPAGAKTLLQELSGGIEQYVGKSTRLVEVVRMFPTVAGVPWRAEVQGTLVASASLRAVSDVVKFLSRQGPLEISGGLDASVAVRVTCQESVAIGDLTSSGIRLNISVLAKGGVEGRMKFEPSPGSQVLEFGLGAIKKPQTLVSARSDIYQLHNGEERVIHTPRTQVPVDMCWPQFLQRWVGHSVCAKGFYQHVPLVPNNPIPFVSGPVHMDVTGQAVDKSLKEFTATFSLVTQPPKEVSARPVVVFSANLSAPGKELQRNFEVMVKVDPETKAVQGRAQVPEFGLFYALDLQSSDKRQRESNRSHLLLSSILSVGPRVLHSFILETQNEETAPSPSADDPAAALLPPSGQPMPPRASSTMMFKMNMSVPDLSLQILTNSSSGLQPGRFAQGLYIRYFCQPQLGILYALHGQPRLAAASGHVSEWTFSNLAVTRGQSLADTWTASDTMTILIPVSDTMTILIPGHNVTLTNEMMANYTWASRDTTINWISGLGTPNVTTDVITMDAEVRNDSVGHHQNLHYVMQLNHRHKYTVKLDGSLRGPLSNMAFQTDIVYTSKANRRERRSVSSITKRLKRMGKEVEEAVESVEEMVVRRGAQFTEMFLQWMAQEPPKKPGGKQAGEGAKEAGGGGVATPSGELASGGSGSPRKPGLLLQLFSKPSWKLDIDANLKFKPKMVADVPKPVGFDLVWDLHVNSPQLKKDLVFFNGTFNRLSRYDVLMDWHLNSEVLNFTLTYFTQQRVDYPRVYHWHYWKLVEFTKHRFDRSFSFLIDLERHDHFVYHVRLQSPRTNLTHEIAFAAPSPELRTVRANISLHTEEPVVDIKYRERSDLTRRGLTTDVSLNSTWFNLALDSDIDWATPGALMATQRLDALGKMPFWKGASHVDVKLKMDMRKVQRKPTLTITHNSTTGQISTMVGQLLDKDLVFFTFSSQQPEVKISMTLLKWRIHLLEPTRLHHSLTWEDPMTKPLFSGLYNFYRTGAHTFLLFGETVADNVYRNVSDMVVPFTNHTIAQVVDRVVQGRMKKVAMSGLDPRQNVPLSMKVMKGGLKLIQALQLSWQNSEMGRLAYRMGVHKTVSTAAWLSTRLHYMVVQDPPFPLKQYVKFYILPNIRAAAATGQFNFSVPLPFVWKQYLSWPQPRLLFRQRQRDMQRIGQRAQRPCPFIAILSRDQIQTFDGFSYDVSVPAKTTCTYLLGTDVLVKNQSLLLTEGSTVMALREASVTLGWDGKVLINQTDILSVSHLPAELVGDQATVTLSKGQLVVGVKDQMRMTYDPQSEIYVIEMAGHLHNRSLGLLGTTTQDPGDDLRLPSGQVKANPAGFQDKYELSGQAACRPKEEAAVSSPPPACDDRHSTMCRELFQDAVSSPLAPCFSIVDPQRFLDLCLRRTCQEMPHNPSRACLVVSAFVRLCAGKGQDVTADTETFQRTCGFKLDGCSSGQRRRGDRAVDMVLSSVLHSRDRLPDEVHSVLASLARHVRRGTRLGLVHSGRQHAQAHLFDGE